MIPVCLIQMRAKFGHLAAPAGGAHLWWGRGCIVGVCLFGMTASAQGVEVPSGQPVTLSEVLLDDGPGEIWLRFRFVAPQISETGGTISYDMAAPDMDHLCQSLALPYMAEYDLTAARIVISLSDRPVEFGESDPAATQFFEAYRPENDRCIWEEL